MAYRSYDDLQRAVISRLDAAGISPAIYAMQKGKLMYLSGRGIKRRRLESVFQREWTEATVEMQVKSIVSRIKAEDLEPVA